ENGVGPLHTPDNRDILPAVRTENRVIWLARHAGSAGFGHGFTDEDRQRKIGHDDAFHGERQPSVGRLIERGRRRTQLEIETMPRFKQAQRQRRRIELETFQIWRRSNDRAFGNWLTRFLANRAIFVKPLAKALFGVGLDRRRGALAEGIGQQRLPAFGRDLFRVIGREPYLLARFGFGQGRGSRFGRTRRQRGSLFLIQQFRRNAAFRLGRWRRLSRFSRFLLAQRSLPAIHRDQIARDQHQQRQSDDHHDHQKEVVHKRPLPVPAPLKRAHQSPLYAMPHS